MVRRRRRPDARPDRLPGAAGPPTPLSRHARARTSDPDTGTSTRSPRAACAFFLACLLPTSGRTSTLAPLLLNWKPSRDAGSPCCPGGPPAHILRCLQCPRPTAETVQMLPRLLSLLPMRPTCFTTHFPPSDFEPPLSDPFHPPRSPRDVSMPPPLQFPPLEPRRSRLPTLTGTPPPTLTHTTQHSHTRSARWYPPSWDANRIAITIWFSHVRPV